MVQAETEPVFLNFSAWLASSMRNSLKEMWEANGGLISNSAKSSFVFSENPFDNDTDWLYDSALNADGHLAVFHPTDIDACLQAGDMGKCALATIICLLQTLKKETSVRFAGEDWNKIYPKSRNRTFEFRQDPRKSTSKTPKLSLAAPKVAVLTPAIGQRSPVQENQGRSTVDHARSVQMRARQLNSSTP